MTTGISVSEQSERTFGACLQATKGTEEDLR